MDEFPSNSRMPREERQAKAEDKKIDPIVTGKVIQRKKPLSKRFAETFVGGDARGVFGYVLMDVLVPAARDMMSDAVSQGIDRLLYGDSRTAGRRHGNRYGGTGSYVSYNKFSSPNNKSPREDPRRADRGRRSSHELDDIILATRVEADEVIDRLYDLVKTYDVATVSDLYQYVGITPNYIDQKWGWTDLTGTEARRQRSGGYLIDLPRPEPIE